MATWEQGRLYVGVTTLHSLWIKGPPVCLVLWYGEVFEREGGRLRVSFCCPRGGVCHGAQFQMLRCLV